jgi:hypothetical protein
VLRRGFYALAPLRIFWRPILIAFAALAPPSPADAGDLLMNGNFESSSGWIGTRFSIPGVCTGRSGNGATLSPDSTGMAYVQQTVKVNGSTGPFTLSGYLKLQSGTSTVMPQVRWLDGAGNLVVTTLSDVSPVQSYTVFTLTPTMAPASAVNAQIRVTATSGAPATVCVDDLSFEGPAFVLPSPTSTPTPTPLPSSATPSPTATATRTPSPTRTPTETHTPRPTTAPTETHTPRPTNEATDTHTPRPTREPTETHTPRPPAAPGESTAATGASPRSTGTQAVPRRAGPGSTSVGSTGGSSPSDAGSQDEEGGGDSLSSQMIDSLGLSTIGEGSAAPFSEVAADVAPSSPDEPARPSKQERHSVPLIFIGLGVAGGLGAARILAKRKRA